MLTKEKEKAWEDDAQAVELESVKVRQPSWPRETKVRSTYEQASLDWEKQRTERLQAEVGALHSTIQDLQFSMKRAQEQVAEADKLKVRGMVRPKDEYNCP
jgi:uncharacterized protein YlxW (UPF0749 family)